jgi:dephospho-CoA kinase
MKVIGLTGGIGSGKSTVAGLLAEFGAKVIDADKIIHEVYAPGTEGLKEVVEAFGEDILTERGEIDRKKLGAKVFNNPEALAVLNRIIHPRGLDLVRTRLREFREQGTAVVILEVILLVEAGWDKLVDEIWVTAVSEDVVIERLQKSRGLSRDEILARIHSQTSNEERIRHADVVIYNDDGYEALKEAVAANWKHISG